jgi:hypothetical protein
VPRPQGAFYVFPNITGTGYSSKTLADKLLDEAGVACLSGTAFGEWGEGHLRFSYANSLDNIQADPDLPHQVSRRRRQASGFLKRRPEKRPKSLSVECSSA